MRFILKAAFWLGLIAFFMPFGGTPKETSAHLSVVGAFVGAQEAIADLSGFCTRAPQACDTGREFAVFAGERIGDGVAMAYSLVQDRVAPASPPAAGSAPANAIAALPAPTDPVMTGAVDAALPVLRGPAAYRPPQRAVETASAVPADPAPLPVATAHRPALAVPTPAPRF
jgi:hypothetical protein